MSLVTMVVTVMLLACYAGAILALTAAIKSIRYGLASQSWPKADAFLQKCVVETSPMGGSNSWDLTVKYKYVVEGVWYTGNCVAIGYPSSNRRDGHEATRRKVLAMKRFVVRYCPERPEMSAILPSTGAWTFAMSAFAMLWWTFTLVFTAIVLVVSGIGPAVLEWFTSSVF